MPIRLAACGLAVALGVSACIPDLGIGEGANITCEGVQDCPEGMSCVIATGALQGRCVRPGSDGVAPTLVPGSVATSRPAVGLGAVVELSFAVSEALLADPLVQFAWSGSATVDVAPVTPRSDADVAAKRYSYRYQASGDEPEQLASLVVEMTDGAGNRGRDSVPGVVGFDFSPPALLVDPAELIIAGPSASPVPPVDVTNGSTLTVLALLDERVVAGSRLLLAAPGPADSPCLAAGVVEASAGAGSTDTALRFSLQFEAAAVAAPPDGVYRVCLSLEDLAGNATGLELGLVQVDTQAPSAPVVDVRSTIVYTRAPWGDERGASASYTVLGAAGAAPGDTYAVVYGAQGERLAFAAVDADGAFGPIELPPPDRNLVWLEVVDRAGNPSARVAVRSGRLVAALSGKIRGDVFSNPHRVIEQPWAPPGLGEDSGFELSEEKLRPAGAAAPALDAQDGVSVEVEGRLEWQLAGKATDLPAGTAQLIMSAWDGERGRGLLYGGVDVGGPSDAMYGIEGLQLTRIYPTSTGPGALVGGSMAYHAGADAIFMFGGIGTSISGRLWRWNSTEWMDAAPGPMPSGLTRFFSAMAYDPIGDRLVVVGGCADGDCDLLLGDCWSWDEAGGWQLISDAPAAPGPRFLASAAWDEANGEVVVFGGFTSRDPAVALDDLWALSGSVWIERTPARSPPPRGVAPMVSVPGGGIYLYGGSTTVGAGAPCDQTSPCLGDFWRWDGTDWQDLGTPPPGARAGHVLLHDKTADELLLLGPPPTVAGVATNELWTYSLATEQWRQVAGGVAMPGRANHALAFDASARRVAAFGGEVAAGQVCDDSDEYCDGVWGWNGLLWTTLEPPPGPGPVARGRALPGVAAGDNGDVFLYGGQGTAPGCDPMSQNCGDFWRWHDSSWELLCGDSFASPCPPGRLRWTSLAYDTARGLVYLFGGLTDGPGGGEGTDALWSWSALGGWTLRCGGSLAPGCAGPALLHSGKLVFHPILDRVLLFGGLEWNDPDWNSVDDVWAWHEAGGAWEPICSGDCGLPASRMAVNAAYDANRARTLIWTGDRPAELFDLNGGTVTVLDASGSTPGMLKYPGMAVDPDRGELVINGGQSLTDVVKDESWTVDISPAARPALLFAIDWRPAGIPYEAVWAVAATALAGGTGYSVDLSTDANTGDADLIGEPIGGAIVEAWDVATRSWVVIASGQHSAAAPATFSGSHVVAGGFVNGGNNQLFVRLVPAAGWGNGPAAAKIVLDHLAVAVDYQLAGPDPAPGN